MSVTFVPVHVLEDGGEETHHVVTLSIEGSSERGKEDVPYVVWVSSCPDAIVSRQDSQDVAFEIRLPRVPGTYYVNVREGMKLGPSVGSSPYEVKLVSSNENVDLDGSFGAPKPSRSSGKPQPSRLSSKKRTVAETFDPFVNRCSSDKLQLAVFAHESLSQEPFQTVSVDATATLSQLRGLILASSPSVSFSFLHGKKKVPVGSEGSMTVASILPPWPFFRRIADNGPEGGQQRVKEIWGDSVSLVNFGERYTRVSAVRVSLDSSGASGSVSQLSTVSVPDPISELREAIGRCNFAEVENLVNRVGADSLLVTSDVFGRRAIHDAMDVSSASSDHVAIASLLLRACPSSATARDGNGKTPFHFAAVRGNLDLILSLLNSLPPQVRDEVLKATDNSGRTMGHDALYHRRWSLAKPLVEAGISLDAVDGGGHSMASLYAEEFGGLVEAAASGSLSRIRDSLFFSAQPVSEIINDGGSLGRRPLHEAAEGGHAEAVAFLLEAGADPALVDSCGQTALHAAVSTKRSSREAVSVLLTKGGQPLVDVRDAKGSTALHTAVARHRPTAILTLLLEAGADASLCDASANNALHLAIADGRTDVVRLLLDHSGTRAPGLAEAFLAPAASLVNARGRYFVFVTDPVVKSKADNFIKAMEKRAVDNSKKKGSKAVSGKTTKTSPKRGGDGGSPSKRRLFGSGVTSGTWLEDGSEETDIGPTPLEVAIRSGHATVTSVLLHYGANPSLVPHGALRLACYLGRCSVANELLQWASMVRSKASAHWDGGNLPGPLVSALEGSECVDGRSALKAASESDDEDFERALIGFASEGRLDVFYVLAAASGFRLTDKQLAAAAGGGHTDLVQLLLRTESAASGSCGGRSLTIALEAAVTQRCEGIVFALLETKGFLGLTAREATVSLAAAAKVGALDLTTHLLTQAGVRAISTSLPSTDAEVHPLLLALLHGHSQVASVLVNHPSLELTPEVACSCLGAAAAQGFFDVVNALLDGAVPPTLPPSSSSSPLAPSGTGDLFRAALTSVAESCCDHGAFALVQRVIVSWGIVPTRACLEGAFRSGSVPLTALLLYAGPHLGSYSSDRLHARGSTSWNLSNAMARSASLSSPSPSPSPSSSSSAPAGQGLEAAFKNRSSLAPLFVGSPPPVMAASTLHPGSPSRSGGSGRSGALGGGGGRRGDGLNSINNTHNAQFLSPTSPVSGGGGGGGLRRSVSLNTSTSPSGSGIGGSGGGGGGGGGSGSGSGNGSGIVGFGHTGAASTLSAAVAASLSRSSPFGKKNGVESPARRAAQLAIQHLLALANKVFRKTSLFQRAGAHVRVSGESLAALEEARVNSLRSDEERRAVIAKTRLGRSLVVSVDGTLVEDGGRGNVAECLASPDWTLVHQAAAEGDTTVLRLLCDTCSGVAGGTAALLNAPVRGLSALTLAVSSGSEEAVDFILSRGGKFPPATAESASYIVEVLLSLIKRGSPAVLPLFWLVAERMPAFSEVVVGRAHALLPAVVNLGDVSLLNYLVCSLNVPLRSVVATDAEDAVRRAQKSMPRATTGDLMKSFVKVYQESFQSDEDIAAFTDQVSPHPFDVLLEKEKSNYHSDEFSSKALAVMWDTLVAPFEGKISPQSSSDESPHQQQQQQQQGPENGTSRNLFIDPQSDLASKYLGAAMRAGACAAVAALLEAGVPSFNIQMSNVLKSGSSSALALSLMSKPGVHVHGADIEAAFSSHNYDEVAQILVHMQTTPLCFDDPDDVLATSIDVTRSGSVRLTTLARVLCKRSGAAGQDADVFPELCERTLVEWPPVAVAAACGYDGALAALLKAGASVNTSVRCQGLIVRPEPELPSLVYCGLEEAVGADGAAIPVGRQREGNEAKVVALDSPTLSLLALAAASGSLSTVKVLLNHGVDLSSRASQEAVVIGCLRCRWSCVAEILAHADKSGVDVLASHEAEDNNSSSNTKTNTSHSNSNINTNNNNLRTRLPAPLLLVLRNGKYDLAKTLLGLGASPHATFSTLSTLNALFVHSIDLVPYTGRTVEQEAKANDVLTLSLVMLKSGVKVEQEVVLAAGHLGYWPIVEWVWDYGPRSVVTDGSARLLQSMAALGGVSYRLLSGLVAANSGEAFPTLESALTHRRWDIVTSLVRFFCSASAAAATTTTTSKSSEEAKQAVSMACAAHGVAAVVDATTGAAPVTLPEGCWNTILSAVVLDGRSVFLPLALARCGESIASLIELHVKVGPEEVPLIYAAAARGRSAMVLLLLTSLEEEEEKEGKQGGSLSSLLSFSNSKGETLLHWAAVGGMTQVIDFLISRNLVAALLPKKTFDGKTAAMYAIDFGHRDLATRLGYVKATDGSADPEGGEIQSDNGLRLRFSDTMRANAAAASVVSQTRAKGHGPDTGTDVITDEASSSSLSRHKPRVSATKVVGVFEASSSGDVETLKRLLATGEDANASSSVNSRHVVSALLVACERGHSEVALMLIKAGASVNFTGGSSSASPLHWAAVHCSLEVVTQLLGLGAAPSARDVSGATPLDYALEGGRLPVILAILASGGRSVSGTVFAPTKTRLALEALLERKVASTLSEFDDGVQPAVLADLLSVIDTSVQAFLQPVYKFTNADGPITSYRSLNRMSKEDVGLVLVATEETPSGDQMAPAFEVLQGSFWDEAFAAFRSRLATPLSSQFVLRVDLESLSLNVAAKDLWLVPRIVQTSFMLGRLEETLESLNADKTGRGLVETLQVGGYKVQFVARAHEAIASLDETGCLIDNICIEEGGVVVAGNLDRLLEQKFNISARRRAQK